ncbi:MAG: type IV secretion system protein [Alphaproteobacteria bacterium]|nr:type IV secretion system protein [Alphaproteobacteria bacterium]
MANLFYTLFKYKEKAPKDELGNYPEKVDIPAFPERRYLWTSRFLVVISCLSVCSSMILGSILCIMIPQKKAAIMPLQIDYKNYQVSRMENVEFRAFAGNLVTESVMAQYITTRYTITDDIEEQRDRFGENNFLYLSSGDKVWEHFQKTERPYFDYLQAKGINREIKIDSIYPVSFNFWQVRFLTIDTYPDRKTPIISKWLASIRMRFNFSKYEDKDLGLKNPYGTTVDIFNLSYLGNNIKSKRN